MVKKKKVVFVTGKRRLAVARAKAMEGKGRIKINSKPLDVWGTDTLRLWIKEPLILAGDLGKKFDFSVNVKGGGIVGQAEAIRQAIAKALVELTKSEELKNKFIEYDRNLLVYDPRRNEPHKPSRSKAGPRRHKQRSKR